LNANDKLIEDLITAINLDDLEEARKILKSGIIPNSSSGGRYSPLHVAAWAGRTEMTKMLINAGADINAREALTGKTPIYNAFSYDVIKMLIDAGADVNIQDTNDHNTVLHNQLFHRDSLNLFLKTDFNLNLTNRMGWNVLHMHTAYGNYWHVDNLLEFGMDIDLENNNGKTALDIASMFKIEECVSVLERHAIKKAINKNSTYESDQSMGL